MAVRHNTFTNLFIVWDCFIVFFFLFFGFLLASAFLGFGLDHLLFGDGGVERRVFGVEVFLLDAADVLVGGFDVVVGGFVVVADFLVAVELLDFVVAEGGSDFLLVDAEGEFLFAFLVFLEVGLEVAMT